MSRISFVRLFSVLALAFWASALSASTITYAVGTCRPNLRSFDTISAALAATPAANGVEVCPGTYNEQVQITQPVTLEGVSEGRSAQAIIASPAGGLVTNANHGGQPVAAQLWVNNASGPVNISNLTVDGSLNGVPVGTEVIGVYYQNSSGAVNSVATLNQSDNGSGFGIRAEGGSSNPLVTIENSSVHDYDEMGIIAAGTDVRTSTLTAVIKGNEVTTVKPGSQIGIYVLISAFTVTGNLLVSPGLEGIFTSSPYHGSISANTVANASNTGILASAAGNASVSSNKVFASPTGITSDGAGAVQSNIITDSTVGIDVFCGNGNVNSNVISDALIGLTNVPRGGRETGNKYFNVRTIHGSSC